MSKQSCSSDGWENLNMSWTTGINCILRYFDLNHVLQPRYENFCNLSLVMQVPFDRLSSILHLFGLHGFKAMLHNVMTLCLPS